ncbi:MAG: enoyl-CoA hydratase [Lautropia sp. SCN 66-9]|nr:MAG: enoyl-CoA hydratase [Lautropia sp. SCN 66-9]
MEQTLSIADPSRLETVRYEQIGAVARILHNRPAARNAESRQLLDELDQAVRHAEADDSVRVLILGGVGDHFSAGHDLKEAQASRANFTVEERWEYESLRYFDYCLRIWDLKKPSIAQVQGACVAGGFMVANSCDLMVAADDAFFSDPVCHTLATASVELLIHPWVMGLRQAKYFLYTGNRVDAREALSMGMVNKVVPRAELEAETLALAQRIAQAPPFALGLLKRSLNRTFDVQGMRHALQAHFETHQLSHLTQEFGRIREQGLASAISRASKA